MLLMFVGTHQLTNTKRMYWNKTTIGSSNYIVLMSYQQSRFLMIFGCFFHGQIGLSESSRQKFPHVVRWIDWIQNQVDSEGSFEKILIENTKFEPQLQKPKSVVKVETDSNAKNVVPDTKNTTNSVADPTSKKSEPVNNVPGNNEAAQEKKQPIKETVEKEMEVSVIRKAWKHHLLVEEIDVGDPKLRQVVSGLAKYFSPDELTNRHVVLITNVKPGKLRDVMSEGLVLCASNEDHTCVELLIPLEGAKLGSVFHFLGSMGLLKLFLTPKRNNWRRLHLSVFLVFNLSGSRIEAL